MALRDLFADTRPLRTPAFRRIWTANIVTVVGAQLTVVAVPVQLYTETHSSMYVGLTGVFGLVPLVLFGLYGGAIADSFDRRRIQLITTSGLVLVGAAFFVQAALGGLNPWLLLTLFSVQQVIFAIDQPTKSAIVPRLLRREQLPAAQALMMTVSQTGAIAGPLLAGVLIPLTGLAGLYLIDTLCLFATLWAVLRLPALPVDGPSSVPGLRSVLDGLAYLRWRPVLLMSFVVDIIAMVFGMPRALFPEIASESFGDPPGGGLAFALLFAAIPIGAVVGGVLSGWVSRVRLQGRAVIRVTMMWGLFIALFGVAVAWAPHDPSTMLAVAVAFLILAGVADLASTSLRGAILQSAAADAMLGRLQGVFLVVVVGGPRVADTAHGFAASWIGTAATTIAGGVLVIVLVLLVGRRAASFTRYRVNA